MYRFFEDKNKEEFTTLNDKNSHHYLNVLRVKEDEEVEVSFLDGVYKCIYNDKVGDKINLKVISKNENSNESDIKLTLFQAILKANKMDEALNGAVQSGVCEIYPLETKRVVAKIKEKEDKKNQRWQRIAEAASKQSKRDYVPIVRKQVDLKFLETLKDTTIIVPYEDEKNIKFHDLDIKNKNIALVIGPEGGFEPDEIEYLKSIGANIITLGNRILRAETAVTVASFYIIYNLER